MTCFWSHRRLWRAIVIQKRVSQVTCLLFFTADVLTWWCYFDTFIKICFLLYAPCSSTIPRVDHLRKNVAPKISTTEFTRCQQTLLPLNGRSEGKKFSQFFFDTIAIQFSVFWAPMISWFKNNSSNKFI